MSCLWQESEKVKAPQPSFKMNKIISIFLLTGDKFMPGLYLKWPGSTYRAFEPFSKHREKIQKFRETGNLKHLYRNESGKKRKKEIFMLIVFFFYRRRYHWTI